MKYLKYNTKTMSDELLWQTVLTPLESGMSKKLLSFLTECVNEFKNRKCKLNSIMK